MGLDVIAYRIPRALATYEGFNQLAANWESSYMEKREISYWRREYELVRRAFGHWPTADEYFVDITDKLWSITKYLLFEAKPDAWFGDDCYTWFKRFDTSDVIFLLKAYWYAFIGQRIIIGASQ